jgi:uncharacterized protein YukE
MADRVVSTGTAREAIKRMQAIINGGLVQQINELNAQGRTLSEPNVWDGRLAAEFRATWPETNRKLTSMKEALEDLRRQIERINQNIMQAGGNQ